MSNPHDLEPFPRPKDQKGQGTEKGQDKGPDKKSTEDRSDQSPLVAWIIIVVMGLLFINGLLYLSGFFGNLLGN